MPFRLFNAWLLALAVAAPTLACGQSVSDEVLALHWNPSSAERAGNRTLAAAIWLEREASVEDWPASLDAIVVQLERAIERAGPGPIFAADGTLAWLVEQRSNRSETRPAAFPEPALTGADELLQNDRAAGRLARLRTIARWQAAAVWQDVSQRLGTDAVARIEQWWAPMLEESIALSDDEGSPAREHALDQAERVRRLAALEEAAERIALRDRMLRAEADFAWESGRFLDAVWLSYEGLLRLLRPGGNRAELAEGWRNWIEGLDPDALREARVIDLDLPLVIALLGEASELLAAVDTTVVPALDELLDVYARLALFAPDLAFYLDQPIREPVRRVLAACRLQPELVGPPPRTLFEDCADGIAELLSDGLGSEELVGGAEGPFAAEFLRREIGLVSWQRAAYLDGHIDWLLQAQCQSPEWINMLEWSLLVNRLVSWIEQRPVFFSSSQWRAILDDIPSRMRGLGRAHVEWLDCITGQGSERRDPVQRLIERHRSALVDLTVLLGQASSEFYDNVTRPGADIDLGGSADQVTSYRPEGLTIGPCPEAASCGARVELPVTRALLGLFPNAFLLADQIGSGELDLCYEQVRWVDRSARPARQEASRVAEYRGRLSFDLVGTFSRGEERQSVFRYRLTDSEPRQYLFAADNDDILAMDCPQELVGQSVDSRLPDDHPGLVPNRLTYFVSTPTTPEAQLTANWDRGAEWRDWFVTGRGVERIEALDGREMEPRVQARLAELTARRERQLSAPLIKPARAEETDPLALAMARASDSAALLRRSLELHYPRIVRQHAPVRGLLAGEAGLLTRDRVRLMRDEGVEVARLPGMGFERIDRMTRAWRALPESLREQGQRSPEVDYALERLAALRRELNR